MTTATLAWVVRSAMVATAAVVAYLLVQSELVLTPETRVLLGAISVALASLNPTTLATKINGE